MNPDQTVLYEGEMDHDFLDEVYKTPGGGKIKHCIQCGTCSGSCPVSWAMEESPRQIFAFIRAGMRDRVLDSLTIWTVRLLLPVRWSGARRRSRSPTSCTRSSASPSARTASAASRRRCLSRKFVDIVNANGRNNETSLMTRYMLAHQPVRRVQGGAHRHAPLLARAAAADRSEGQGHRQPAQDHRQGGRAGRRGPAAGGEVMKCTYYPGCSQHCDRARLRGVHPDGGQAARSRARDARGLELLRRDGVHERERGAVVLPDGAQPLAGRQDGPHRRHALQRLLHQPAQDQRLHGRVPGGEGQGRRGARGRRAWPTTARCRPSTCSR